MFICKILSAGGVTEVMHTLAVQQPVFEVAGAEKGSPIAEPRGFLYLVVLRVLCGQVRCPPSPQCPLWLNLSPQLRPRILRIKLG
jgi:hypothetical protein